MGEEPLWLLVQLIGEGRYTSLLHKNAIVMTLDWGQRSQRSILFSWMWKEREENIFLLSTRRPNLMNGIKSTYHLAYALGLLLYNEKSL